MVPILRPPRCLKMWNFDRIKYDDMLKTKNKKYLKIKYIISGWEDYMDIINEVILLNY
jgi:hypothetical protein